MDEPRKIVLILGNGFDLDLGLKTSYKDFWESNFCPKDYPAPLIHHLNQCWPGQLEKVKWYDLENELYNYYKGTQNKPIDVITKDERAFIAYFYETELAFTIPAQYGKQAKSLWEKGFLKRGAPVTRYFFPYGKDLLETPIWRDMEALRRIKIGLCDYLKSIDLESINDAAISLEVLSSVVEAKQNGQIVSIYTFNYTPLPYGYEGAYPNMTHHVHGTCNKGNIIVGTQDVGDYSDSYDFLEKSMDPCFNPPQIVAGMLEADDVIVFGHSIGENDRQYFKSFFTRQVNYESAIQKDITFFTLDDQSELEIKRSLQKMTNHSLSTLLGLNHVVFFKTSKINESPSAYRKFLSKYNNGVKNTLP